MPEISQQLRELLDDRFPGDVIISDPSRWLDPPTDRDIDFQVGWWAALTMIVNTASVGLTDNEHAIVSKVGELADD